MRKISNIRLTGLIFHILDHHSATGLVLSEAPISIEGRENISEYISDHISKSLADELTKAALFISPSETEPNEIEQISRSLINNSTDLLNGSQQIAKRLYESINGNTNISSGVLAVSLFQDIEDNNKTYLALLKLDRADVFRSHTKNLEGKKVVDFETIPNVLPTKGERLQKCAFVRSSSEENEYDLMILDRQTREPETVAKFFAQKFLGIELAFDRKARTSSLYRGLTEAHNKIRTDLTWEQNYAFDQARVVIMSFTSVDVDDFIANLNLPEDAKQKINDTVAEFVPDRQFRIDPALGKKKSRKKVYKGDQGFKLEFDHKWESDIVQSLNTIKGNNGATLGTELVIHVRGLVE